MSRKLEILQGLVEDRLGSLFQENHGAHADLVKAMNYSLLAGGKRFRPSLLLASCQACQGDVDAAIDAACALECIHCYSLIHDDLPAMDDDDLRRGQATNHKVFGEGMAILAGDGLLTEAFSIIARDWQKRQKPEVGLELVGILAAAAGADGMVAGQALDLASENQDVDAATMKNIHWQKTGKLIEGACLMGAAVAEASAEARQALAEYAQALGLAFQIVDDLLDVEGDPKSLGKAVGSDARNQKATYPVLYGIDASRKQAEKLKNDALQALKRLPGDVTALRELAEMTVERSH